MHKYEHRYGKALIKITLINITRLTHLINRYNKKGEKQRQSL
jgi:hypothetical protein